MAIADNTFTPEELTAAVTANPALRDHLVGAVKTANYVVRTADEDSTFIGTKTKEIYDGLDNDIFQTSGIAKNPTEKRYDFAKRVIGGLKTSVTDATTPLQQKILDLEKTISEGSGDATMKAQLEALQKKEADLQKDLEDKDNKLFQKDVMLDVRDGLRGLKFDASVKDSLRKMAVDNATASIVGMAKLQKNADNTESIVYIGENGSVILNKDNKVATAADVLETVLKDILDEGQPGAGGGAGGNGSGGAGGANRKALPTALPGTVKNQGQLMVFLKEYGLAEGTTEYDTAWDKFSAGLPLR